MAGIVTAKVDVTAFNAIFKQYLKFSRRELADSLNAKMYYITCNATNTTHKVEKQTIEADLRKPSKVNPNVPLAAILVNAERARKGKKGLWGAKMAKAMETLINVKKRAATFVASSWISAIKDLAPYVRQKAGYRKNALTKIRGKSRGGAMPARDPNKAVQKVTSWVDIKQDIGQRGTSVLTEGMQQAFNREAKSMIEYINKKLGAYKGK